MTTIERRAPESGDIALLRRAREGDAAAFEALIERHRARILVVCHNVVGNPHDAEDAYQDAALAAWQHLTTFRGDAQFSSWLHRVAFNAAHQILRRRPRAELVDFTAEDICGRVSDRDVAAQIVVRDSLRSALQKLPDTFSAALVMRECGAMSIREIATAQGVGESTVKTRLHRARSLARRQLAVA